MVVKMNKKAFIITGTFTIIVVSILLFVFIGIPITGLIKFLFTDKTPLIILGVFILLMVIGKKKRGN